MIGTHWRTNPHIGIKKSAVEYFSITPSLLATKEIFKASVTFGICVFSTVFATWAFRVQIYFVLNVTLHELCDFQICLTWKIYVSKYKLLLLEANLSYLPHVSSDRSSITLEIMFPWHFLLLLWLHLFFPRIYHGLLVLPSWNCLCKRKVEFIKCGVLWRVMKTFLSGILKF